jgi:hypothetical protein
MRTKLTVFFLCFSLIIHAQNPSPTDSTKNKKKYKPELSGFFQGHYLNEFNTNGDSIRDPDGFRMLRVRLTVKGKISDKMSYQISVDPRSPEQAGLLRDAYLEYNFWGKQKLRIGQQKTQFGYENRQSSSELYTVNRAEMSDGLSRGENLRDVGIGLIGQTSLGEKWKFENAITFTNGTRSNVRGPFDFNTRKALWGRLGLAFKNDNWSFNYGISFGYGGLRYLGDDVVNPADDIYLKFQRLGTDFQLEHKRFFMMGEFGLGKDHAGDTLYGEPMGYQVLFALKTKYKIGPIVRYDVFEDEWSVFTLGAYYGKLKDKFRIIVNYVMRGNVKDIPQGHDDRLYVQLQVSF